MVIRMPMSVEDVARWMAGATGTPDEKYRHILRLLTTLLAEERGTMASLLEALGVFVKSMEDPFNDEDYSWMTRKLRNWADIVREHGPDHVVMDERVVCRDAPPEDVLPGEEHKREEEAERKKAAAEEEKRRQAEAERPRREAAQRAADEARAACRAVEGLESWEVDAHASAVYRAVFGGHEPPPATPKPKKKPERRPPRSRPEPGGKPRVPELPPATPTTTATAAVTPAPAATPDTASPGAPASPTVRPRRPPAPPPAGQLALEPGAPRDADHNGDGGGDE